MPQTQNDLETKAGFKTKTLDPHSDIHAQFLRCLNWGALLHTLLSKAKSHRAFIFLRSHDRALVLCMEDKNYPKQSNKIAEIKEIDTPRTNCWSFNLNNVPFLEKLMQEDSTANSEDRKWRPLFEEMKLISKNSSVTFPNVTASPTLIGKGLLNQNGDQGHILQMNRLQAELGSATQKINELQGLVAEQERQKKENESLILQLQEANRKAEAASRENDQIVQAKQDEALQKVNDANRKAESAEALVTNKEKELATKTARIGEIENQKSQLQQELDEAKRAKSAQIQQGQAEDKTKLEQTEQLVAALRTELATEKGKIEEIQKDRDSFKQQLTVAQQAKSAQIQQGQAEDKTKLEQTEQLVAALRTELATEKGKIEEIQKDRDSFKQQLDQAQQAQAQPIQQVAPEANAELKETQEKVVSLQSQLAAQTTKIGEIEKQKSQLQQQLDQAKQAQAQPIQQGQAEDNTKLEQAEQRVAALTAELATERGKIEAIQKDKDELKQKLLEAQQNLANIQKQDAGSQSDFDELTHKFTVLKEQNSAMESAIEKYKEEAAQQTRIINSREESLQKVKEKLDKAMKKKSESEIIQDKVVLDMILDESFDRDDAAKISRELDDNKIPAEISERVKDLHNRLQGSADAGDNSAQIQERISRIQALTSEFNAKNEEIKLKHTTQTKPTVNILAKIMALGESQIGTTVVGRSTAKPPRLPKLVDPKGGASGEGSSASVGGNAGEDVSGRAQNKKHKPSSSTSQKTKPQIKSLLVLSGEDWRKYQDGKIWDLDENATGFLLGEKKPNTKEFNWNNFDVLGTNKFGKMNDDEYSKIGYGPSQVERSAVYVSIPAPQQGEDQLFEVHKMTLCKYIVNYWGFADKEKFQWFNLLFGETISNLLSEREQQASLTVKELFEFLNGKLTKKMLVSSLKDDYRLQFLHKFCVVFGKCSGVVESLGELLQKIYEYSSMAEAREAIQKGDANFGGDKSLLRVITTFLKKIETLTARYDDEFSPGDIVLDQTINLRKIETPETGEESDQKFFDEIKDDLQSLQYVCGDTKKDPNKQQFVKNRFRAVLLDSGLEIIMSLPGKDFNITDDMTLKYGDKMNLPNGDKMKKEVTISNLTMQFFLNAQHEWTKPKEEEVDDPFLRYTEALAPGAKKDTQKEILDWCLQQVGNDSIQQEQMEPFKKILREVGLVEDVDDDVNSVLKLTQDLGDFPTPEEMIALFREIVQTSKKEGIGNEKYIRLCILLTILRNKIILVSGELSGETLTSLTNIELPENGEDDPDSNKFLAAVQESAKTSLKKAKTELEQIKSGEAGESAAGLMLSEESASSLDLILGSSVPTGDDLITSNHLLQKLQEAQELGENPEQNIKRYTRQNIFNMQSDEEEKPDEEKLKDLCAQMGLESDNYWISLGNDLKSELEKSPDNPETDTDDLLKKLAVANTYLEQESSDEESTSEIPMSETEIILKMVNNPQTGISLKKRYRKLLLKTTTKGSKLARCLLGDEEPQQGEGADEKPFLKIRDAVSDSVSVSDLIFQASGVSGDQDNHEENIKAIVESVLPGFSTSTIIEALERCDDEFQKGDMAGPNHNEVRVLAAISAVARFANSTVPDGFTEHQFLQLLQREMGLLSQVYMPAPPSQPNDKGAHPRHKFIKSIMTMIEARQKQIKDIEEARPGLGDTLMSLGAAASSMTSGIATGTAKLAWETGSNIINRFRQKEAREATATEYFSELYEIDQTAFKAIIDDKIINFDKKRLEREEWKVGRFKDFPAYELFDTIKVENFTEEEREDERYVEHLESFSDKLELFLHLKPPQLKQTVHLKSNIRSFKNQITQLYKKLHGAMPDDVAQDFERMWKKCSMNLLTFVILHNHGSFKTLVSHFKITPLTTLFMALYDIVDDAEDAKSGALPYWLGTEWLKPEFMKAQNKNAEKIRKAIADRILSVESFPVVEDEEEEEEEEQNETDSGWSYFFYSKAPKQPEPEQTETETEQEEQPEFVEVDPEKRMFTVPGDDDNLKFYETILRLIIGIIHAKDKAELDSMWDNGFVSYNDGIMEKQEKLDACLNVEENLGYVIDHWNRFQYPEYYASPKSSTRSSPSSIKSEEVVHSDDSPEKESPNLDLGELLQQYKGAVEKGDAKLEKNSPVQRPPKPAQDTKIFDTLLDIQRLNTYKEYETTQHYLELNHKKAMFKKIQRDAGEPRMSNPKLTDKLANEIIADEKRMLLFVDIGEKLEKGVLKPNIEVEGPCYIEMPKEYFEDKTGVDQAYPGQFYISQSSAPHEACFTEVNDYYAQGTPAMYYYAVQPAWNQAYQSYTAASGYMW